MTTVSPNPCIYCAQDERLTNLTIEIAELQASVLYLFKEQTYRGRCVLAYKKEHKNEIFELSKEERDLFMDDLTRAAKAIHTAFNPDKVNYGAYGDKMPHIHFHLVPKYEDAPQWGSTFVMFPEPTQHLQDSEYAEMIEKIKSHL